MTDTATTKNEFPAWLPPTVVKELRQGMRSAGFSSAILLLPTILALIFILGFINNSRGTFLESSFINNTFWLLYGLFLLIVIPMRALKGVNSEISSRTADLLVLTKLTPWRIVWGKWCSLMIQTLLLTITLLPFAIVRYYYGSIDLLSDFLRAVAIFTASGVFSAIALWASGTHNAFRILFIIIIFLGIRMVGSLLDAGSLDIGGRLIGTYLIILYDLVITTLMFLVLASKWFTLPTANISRCLRVLLFAFFIPDLVMLLLCVTGMMQWSDLHEIFYSHHIILIAMLTFAAILEVTSPQRLMPVHIAIKGRERFARFKNIFLVPGIFSASMFALLLATTAFFIFAIMAWKDFPPMSEHSLYIYLAIMMWWSSLVIPAFILLPFKQVLQTKTMIVYLALAGIMIGGASILKYTQYKTIAFFLPWGALFMEPDFKMTKGLDGILTSSNIIIMCMFLAALLLVCISSRFWKLIKMKASKNDSLIERSQEVS